MAETKSEVVARISELDALLDAVEGRLGPGAAEVLREAVEDRVRALRLQFEAADEDLFKSVVRSHEVLCTVKQMDEKAAYGQDPAMYYSLAICGEAGEMANKIVKALRNGNDPDAARRAVISELPDVFIYGAVLAHVLEIDLTREVNGKVAVVTERARSGYYGGPLPPGTRGRNAG